jgi:hypothetical protein
MFVGDLAHLSYTSFATLYTISLHPSVTDLDSFCLNEIDYLKITPTFSFAEPYDAYSAIPNDTILVRNESTHNFMSKALFLQILGSLCPQSVLQRRAVTTDRFL